MHAKFHLCVSGQLQSSRPDETGMYDVRQELINYKAVNMIRQECMMSDKNLSITEQ